MNTTELFNDGWEFAKSSLDQQDWRGLGFAPVDLPHDWLIYNTLDLYENSIGWYRRIYDHQEQDQQVLLSFDGVYMDSSLYVNGCFVGEWKYGYSSFEHDISTFLKAGQNEIILKVVYQSPNSRWYSGAGIYRNVWLKKRGPSFIETDGTYVAARETGKGWAVEVETEIVCQAPLRVRHAIADSNGDVVAESAQEVFEDGLVLDQQVLTVRSPKLWSTKDPVLYNLTTELYVSENGHWELVESLCQNLGFRTIVMDPQDGLYLNGSPIKLNGVCEHHDLGALGAAFNIHALRRRFEILKDMGVNAIRTAHNMPAREFMDLADEMGFLVVSEAFDMWERPKTKYDYARFFNDWAERDIRSWVRRDRNHPSLLMWSIGNEIYDTHASERGQEITKRLRDYVCAHDPKGNAPVTIGSNYMPWENARKCADILKIAGYNYADKYYEQHHAEYPDWVIYGSETASVVQSRGIYHFPFDHAILADDDEQCSALGNSRTSWGAESHEATIIAHRDPSYVLGQFIWTGFDYIGEPTPYHTKNSYFGQIDTATFKKDTYYIYQSAWTDYREAPMVHIFPYWDFSLGQIIDVRVCSNAPSVELKLNGQLVGQHSFDHVTGKDIVATWQVPYEPGLLEAIAYDEQGNVIATAERRSFGDTVRLRLTPDKQTLVADGLDLIFLEISAEDGAGNPVENARDRVYIKVTGAGRLIGLDNGDSTDYDQYKGLSRRLFSGKLMAVIGARLEPGPIKVEVSSPGLTTEVLELAALPAAPVIGLSAQTENQEMPIVTGQLGEKPVRKIELSCGGGQVLDGDNPDVMVTAKIYPADASYQDVEWSVVAPGGIPSNLAVIEDKGQTAKITALGDGKFRVRCTTTNGTDKPKLISELEFEAVGLGTAYKDPYDWIAGGLYDYVKGEVGPGNERGVATSRDGETHVGYRYIDFGPYGSDTITIPIFTLNNEPYSIQIWEGMPDEDGSALLADLVYQKQSIWNTYQPETYKLPRRLKGITSICFVLQNKAHIKGFFFERQSRAYSHNKALDCDHIYGDTFTLQSDAVEGIGNNVSLVFDEMDFGEQGTARILICGRAPVDNTIHISFTGSTGTSRQIIEFGKSDTYVEREFELTPVSGKQSVSFIFLPGSNFDFAWFKFQGR